MEAHQNKNFQFDPPFEKDALWELYQDDYQTIEELLSLSLANFDSDLGEITDSYAQSEVNKLLRAIHKFKPTFGFLGLSAIQEKCTQFEDNCKSKGLTDTTIAEYHSLIESLQDAKLLIEKTYLQLKEFNTQFL